MKALAPEGSVHLYGVEDRYLVPFLSHAERFLPIPFGQSLITIRSPLP